MTDHKLKVHQIPTNTPQKELHHMDLQETIVLRIQRAREKAIQLLTTGRRSTKNYSRIIGGGEHHLRWCLDWIWWFWTLRRLYEYFIDSPRVSGIFWGIYREKRRFGGGREVGTTHQGALVPPAAPWWVAFGLHLILISCDVKNMQKTTTGTSHYVNRLVPKNDIK